MKGVGVGGSPGWAAASGRHPARQILTSSPSPRNPPPPLHPTPPSPNRPPSVCPTKLHQRREAHLVCRADRRSLVHMTQLAEWQQRVSGGKDRDCCRVTVATHRISCLCFLLILFSFLLVLQMLCRRVTPFCR